MTEKNKRNVFERSNSTCEIAGHDGISNRGLKRFTTKAMAVFTNIMNAMMRLRYFSKTWKVSQFTVVSKSGKDRQFSQNYRSINLLPDMRRIVERIMMKRIEEHTEEMGILEAG